jgi:hypothetical protein
VRPSDRVTANLPAISFEATSSFYAQFGFQTVFRNSGWMILGRGLLEIEFFPYPDLDPYQSSFGACVRVANLDDLYTDWLAAKLPDAGIPRLTPPKLEPFGMRMFALVDLNGSLLRCIEEPAD